MPLRPRRQRRNDGFPGRLTGERFVVYQPVHGISHRVMTRAAVRRLVRLGRIDPADADHVLPLLTEGDES